MNGWVPPLLDWPEAQSAISIIAGKWTSLIFAELGKGPQGYNMLVRATSLNTKTLNRYLRSMEDAGLVKRQLRSERPLRVTYSLTSSAQALLGLLSDLARWKEELNEDRRSHD